jgi:hypothetical protein
MKKAIILFLAFGIALNLIAQKRINLDTLNIDQLNLSMGKAEKLKNTGLTLTLAGLSVFVIFEGLALNMILNHALPGYERSEWEARINTCAGIGLIGLTSMVAGAPLWIIGNRRISDIDIVLKKHALKPNNSMMVGLSFRIRF